MVFEMSEMNVEMSQLGGVYFDIGLIDLMAYSFDVGIENVCTLICRLKSNDCAANQGLSSN